MNAFARIDPRPEAMGDVPGVCDLPLTRAVVQYRDVHETDDPGGRIEDIGLAVVMEGRYASAAETIDLGSARVKVLDLSTELVVLDWVHEPTLHHLGELISGAAASRDPDRLRRYSFDVGLRVLERVGFGPLTRATFLRIGYRDVCRDLDLHEGTSIRIVLGPGRLTRAYLDYDVCALVFRTALTAPDVALESALHEAFSHAELHRVLPGSAGGSMVYRVRFPLPTTVAEARSSLAAMRRGLASMMARFEPRRYGALAGALETFGTRETLAGLRVHERPAQAEPLRPMSGSSSVH